MLELSKGTLIGFGIALSSSFALAQITQDEWPIITSTSKRILQTSTVGPTPVSSGAAEGFDIEKDENPLPTPELMNILRHSQDKAARLSATRSLGLRGQQDAALRPSVTDFFVRHLSSGTEPNGSLRWMMTSSLALLALEENHEAGENVAKLFATLAISDPDPEVRGSAASGLAELAEKHRSLVPSAVTTLGKILLDEKPDPAPGVRLRAVRGMAWLGLRYPALLPSAYKIIDDCIVDEKANDPRWQCVKSLSWFGEQYPNHAAQTMNRLIETLNDPDRDIRVEAIGGIGRLSRKHPSVASLGKAALIGTMQKKDELPDVIEYASQVVGSIKDKTEKTPSP